LNGPLPWRTQKPILRFVLFTLFTPLVSSFQCGFRGALTTSVNVFHFARCLKSFHSVVVDCSPRGFGTRLVVLLRRPFPCDLFFSNLANRGHRVSRSFHLVRSMGKILAPPLQASIVGDSLSGLGEFVLLIGLTAARIVRNEGSHSYLPISLLAFFPCCLFCFFFVFFFGFPLGSVFFCGVKFDSGGWVWSPIP